MRTRTRCRIYIVVRVWRGIAAAVKSFRTLADAQEFVEMLRLKSDPMEEDVQIFDNFI